MTNFIWISSYIADLLFMWLFFKRSAYAPQRQNKWLKPILSVILIILYLNNAFLSIPYASLRIGLRAIIYLLWIYAAEGVPLRPAVYAAIFWAGVYTILQNVFFGPFFNAWFSGQTDIISGSRLLSQLVLSLINLTVRFVYFGAISKLLPFEGIAGAHLPHIIFAAGICALSVYTKDTSARMSRSFEDGPSLFSVYFVLLHIAMLLALVIFEYSRRRDVERASLQIQNNTTKALMQSIQDRQMSEDAVRTLRHDLKNHAISLQLLLEHGETQKAMEYLENFRSAAKNPVDGFETGSQLLNGLLRQKLSPAKERGIDVSCKLDFTEGSFIDNFDLCVIIGNILDNAVEACDALPEGSHRYIKVSGGPAANYMNIEVENASARKAHLLDGLPATSKADKAMHGFGLRSVKAVVERYNGIMNIEQNDSSYSISLMIPKPSS